MTKKRKKHKKHKKIQLGSYKAALKSMQQYIADRDKGKIARSSVVEDFITKITPYLNKNGTLSKRALRYNKAKIVFNAVIKEYRASPYSRRAVRKKVTNKIKNTMYNNGLVNSKKHADKAIKMFADSSIHYLMDTCGYSSDDVIDMAGDEEIAIDDILLMAHYMQRQIDERTPDEMQSVITQDDLVQAIDKFKDDVLRGSTGSEVIEIYERATSEGLDTDDIMYLIQEEGYTLNEAVQVLKDSLGI
jgi:hypothetical protein